MQILMTAQFTKWLLQMKDGHGRSRIMDRVDRLAEGNPGDSRSVGGGVVELKINAGPGISSLLFGKGHSFSSFYCAAAIRRLRTKTSD